LARVATRARVARAVVVVVVVDAARRPRTTGATVFAFARASMVT